MGGGAIALSILLTIIVVYGLGNKFVYEMYNKVMNRISGFILRE